MACLTQRTIDLECVSGALKLEMRMVEVEVSNERMEEK